MRFFVTVVASLLIMTNSGFAEGSKKLHAHSNGVSLLFGIINAGVDIPFADETWSVGPSMWHINSNAGFWSLQATALGARVNKHFMGKSYEDSWYVGASPYVVYVRGDFYGFTGSGIGFHATASGGYQWAWETFATRLGVGYGLDAPIVDWTIGFLF